MIDLSNAYIVVNKTSDKTKKKNDTILYFQSKVNEIQDQLLNHYYDNLNENNVTNMRYIWCW